MPTTFPSLATLPRNIDAVVSIVRPAAVAATLRRAYHNATVKMTRRAYIFDDEFVVVCCLG